MTDLCLLSGTGRFSLRSAHSSYLDINLILQSPWTVWRNFLQNFAVPVVKGGRLIHILCYSRASETIQRVIVELGTWTWINGKLLR